MIGANGASPIPRPSLVTSIVAKLEAAPVLSGDGPGPVGLPAVKEEHQAHGRKGPRALAVLGISESEYVTRFTSPAQTDWVMRCTARKVLRVPEQEPIVLPPAKAQRAA